jgi:ribonuclease BN (tRNA processing enzyme)
VGEGELRTRLVNGVFGDPLLEVQLRGERRRFLFDLGDAAQLSRRVLHTVSHVFISHAHFDHVCGFLHLLRARMTGNYPPVNLYGPPGLSDHVAGFVAGICWDRIGDAGPEFQVAEVHPDKLCWRLVKAGRPSTVLPATPLTAGRVLDEPAVTVSATVLDHGIPVLAYRLDTAATLHVRKDRLEAEGLVAGPWLSELKSLAARGEHGAEVGLPDGRRETVAQLEAALLERAPGRSLAYATDFADTPDNRRRLTRHAQGAELFFCEATFCEADADQAQATQHLTTRACGELALAAGVKRLVPFHFSKRYNHAADRVYAEVRAACADLPMTRAAAYR